GGLGRIGDDAPAGESFPEVVIRVAFELERDAAGNEGAEALASGAAELVVDGAVRQALGAVAASNLPAEHGADGAMHVADGEASDDGRLILNRRLGFGDEGMVERDVQA